MHDIEDEEDWGVELPPLEELPPDESDDGFSPEELGVEALPTAVESEDIGLDDSTGLDDGAPLFSLDLPPDEVDDESAVDVIPLADDLGEGAEYGWTEEAESEIEESWDSSDTDLPELSPLGRDSTGGEEGVDEDFDLGGEHDDDVPNLPPLLGEFDDDDEDDTLGLEMAFPIEAEFERLLERAENELPPVSEGLTCEVLLDLPMRSAFVGSDVWAVGPGGVYRGTERVSAAGLEGVPSSIVVAPQTAWILVGTERGGHRSSDGGQTFAAIAEFGAQSMTFSIESDGSAWALGASGRVQRSSDGGITWSPPLLLTRIVAMSSPGVGMVTLSAPESAKAQVAASVDGGRRWAACDAPSLARPEGALGYMIAALGNDIVVASSADTAGPFLFTKERSWRRLTGLPPTRALALRDESGLVIYAAHGNAESGYAIARYVVERDADAGVVYQGLGRIWALIPDSDDALLAATDAGLVRITVGGAN